MELATKYFSSPKQGSMLQVSIPTMSPLQGRPPKAGAGLVPERYRLLIPTSHVLLQALHGVQLLHPQSTEKQAQGEIRKKTERTGDKWGENKRLVDSKRQGGSKKVNVTAINSNATYQGRELFRTPFLH